MKLGFWGCTRIRVLCRSYLGGKEKGKDGEIEGGQEEEEAGDQGTHKNVQEAWLYIRALEILLARETREKDRNGERKSRRQLPITLRRRC